MTITHNSAAIASVSQAQAAAIFSEIYRGDEGGRQAKETQVRRASIVSKNGDVKT